MVTTFYPPYHAGGDAIYVFNLSNALARRGHQVEVVHDLDASHLLCPSKPRPGFENHPNVVVHALKSRWGMLSPLATQQTGLPLFKPRLKELLEAGGYDAIHFHNVSLIGPGAFRYGAGLKLMTVHEFWLVCPTHLLWKFERAACVRRACLRCMVRSGRPPQWWRYTGFLGRQLEHIDQFLSPSRFACDKHAELGIRRPLAVLPGFAPDSWAAEAGGPSPHPRSYFLFVGRLVKAKGLQSILPVFRDYPHADLLVAGDGEYAPALKAMARDLPNVRFIGAQSSGQLRLLYRHAIGLVVPSVCCEVLPTVALEAFAQKTPVIARAIGGMTEMLESSGAGILFHDESELPGAMARLQEDAALRRSLGENGYKAFRTIWSEEPHLKAYLDLIEAVAARKRAGA